MFQYHRQFSSKVVMFLLGTSSTSSSKHLKERMDVRDLLFAVRAE